MKALMERRSKLKKKLKGCENVFAAWTSLAHPSITEIFSKTNVDFVGIDIEHSTIDQEQSQRIIASAQAYGSLCLPRIASHNAEMTRRLLDSGADGIIVPMVSTVEEIQKIVSWCKYPPLGSRGFGVARAQGYGLEFQEYIKEWNDFSSIIIQIESIQAVNQIDKLLAVKEIDGVMVGPYDISGSLGIPGQIDHPDVIKAGRKIIEACRKFKKSCGTQVVEPDENTIKNAFQSGYNLVILASDIFLLWKWAERMRGHIKSFRV